MYSVHRESSDVELENSNLNKILDTFSTFSERTIMYHDELKDILRRIKELKEKLKTPKSNGHFIDCVWSNPNCQCGPDTCHCCYTTWTPRYFAQEIVKTMGVDYILWSLQQK